MSENCREIEPLLSPYLDGELDADTRRHVEAHLAACDACRATLEEWRRAEGVLRTVRPARSDVEWERLAQRVEAAIDVEDRKAPAAAAAAMGSRAATTSRGAGRRWWLWGGSGALVAAALVALFWPWVVPRPTEPPTLPTFEGTRGLPPPQKPEAGAAALDDARLGKSVPEASVRREESAVPAPERKARADVAAPRGERRRNFAPNAAPPGAAAGAPKGTVGGCLGETGGFEADEAAGRAARREHRARAGGRARDGAGRATQLPRSTATKVSCRRRASRMLGEDRPRRPDSFRDGHREAGSGVADGRSSSRREAK